MLFQSVDSVQKAEPRRGKTPNAPTRLPPKTSSRDPTPPPSSALIASCFITARPRMSSTRLFAPSTQQPARSTRRGAPVQPGGTPKKPGGAPVQPSETDYKSDFCSPCASPWSAPDFNLPIPDNSPALKRWAIVRTLADGGCSRASSCGRATFTATCACWRARG